LTSLPELRPYESATPSWRTESSPDTPSHLDWPMMFYPYDPTNGFSTEAPSWPCMMEAPAPPLPEAQMKWYDSRPPGGRQRKRGSGTSSFDDSLQRSRHEKGQRGRALVLDEQKSLEIIADARRVAMEGRTGKVWDLACRDRESSFAVQRAIEIMSSTLTGSSAQQDWASYEMAMFDTHALLGDLNGRVIEALTQPHANHVIKQAVQVLPTEYIGFIAQELMGHGMWAAKHCYGCRTVLRLVHHCGHGGWASECAEAVVREVLDNSVDLCSDEFGKFVLEEFLHSGSVEHRRHIIQALSSRLMRNAKHKHASSLLEKVFRHCHEDDTAGIIDELIGNPETVQSLMRTQFGMHVLRDLVLSGQHAKKVRDALCSLADELQASQRGRRLMELVAHPDSAPYH